MWRVLQTLLLCGVLTGLHMQVSADILEEPGVFSTTPTDSENGFFIEPRASGLVFLHHSVINISIAADFDVAAILTYQRGKNEVDKTPGLNYVKIETRKVSWTPLNISIEDPTFPNEYVFRCFDMTKWEQDIYENYSHPESFWSPVFKITNDPASVVHSISSSLQPSTSSSQTPPDSTSTRALESESASANTAQLPPAGLSSTAKRDIALAVSLALGGAAILGFVLFFLLRRRRLKRKAAQLSPATSVPSAQPPVAESHSYHAVPGKMQEVRASDVPRERGVSELSTEGMVPRVQDLDELVTPKKR